VPEGFERFERLIEVVSLDEADRLRARDRWKHYAARGYAIERKDLVLKEA
jgi:DNA polymerase-3 subunit chi